MRLQKVISKLKPEIFKIGEFQVSMVAHRRAIAELRHSQIDAILVDKESILKEILMDDKLYLKPIFFIGTTKRQCDAEISSQEDIIIKRKLETLLPIISNYQDLTLPQDTEKRLLTKIIRYLVTRRAALKAINNRLSSIGYSFPLIEDMSIEADPMHMIKNLNDYTHQNYFNKEPIDKINICYDCQGSYLNFSECCTKCNSLDLKTEELVHHFRCAYVGPLSDFKKDEKLICPKCDHQLKHIGIDYDKPSEIHTCRSCNHSSQETKMKAKCVDCSKENELDQLVTHEICHYKITEKAKAFAEQSEEATSFGAVASKENSSFINLGAFNLIKNHEGRKASNPTTDTYSIILSVDPQLLDQLNPGLQLSLLEELGTIIKPYLLPNDLITLGENQHIHTLLIDYSLEAVRELNEILHYNLNKMLADNGWGKDEMITSSVKSIRS